MANKDCCSHKTKHRDEKEYNNLISRLNKIEGQIRGLKKMLEDERYCIDILNQVSAVSAALNSFGKVLLTNHIKSCVVEDIKSGDTDTIDELCNTLNRFMK